MFKAYSNTMTGSEGANSIYTVATTVTLRNGTRVGIGYRALGGGAFRVRVEPANAKIQLPSWTQPSSSQNRFSKVVNNEDAMVAAVVEAKKAVLASDKETVTEKLAKALSANF